MTSIPNKCLVARNPRKAENSHLRPSRNENTLVLRGPLLRFESPLNSAPQNLRKKVIVATIPFCRAGTSRLKKWGEPKSHSPPFRPRSSWAMACMFLPLWRSTRLRGRLSGCSLTCSRFELARCRAGRLFCFSFPMYRPWSELAAQDTFTLNAEDVCYAMGMPDLWREVCVQTRCCAIFRSLCQCSAIGCRGNLQFSHFKVIDQTRFRWSMLIKNLLDLE
jgi:hypothetical protein